MLGLHEAAQNVARGEPAVRELGIRQVVAAYTAAMTKESPSGPLELRLGEAEALLL